VGLRAHSSELWNNLGAPLLSLKRGRVRIQQLGVERQPDGASSSFQLCALALVKCQLMSPQLLNVVGRLEGLRRWAEAAAQVCSEQAGVALFGVKGCVTSIVLQTHLSLVLDFLREVVRWWVLYERVHIVKEYPSAQAERADWFGGHGGNLFVRNGR